MPRRENVRENMSKGKMSDSEGECLTLAVYASFDADCDAIHRNCRRGPVIRLTGCFIWPRHTETHCVRPDEETLLVRANPD